MINKYTIDPPIVKQAGDVVNVIGNRRLEQWRGDVLIRSVDLTEPQKLTDIATVGGEKYVVASGFPTTPGKYRQEWEVTFSDGTVHTFPSGSYNTLHILDDLN